MSNSFEPKERKECRNLSCKENSPTGKPRSPGEDRGVVAPLYFIPKIYRYV